MYKIIFTGSANAFYTGLDNFNSNFLIQSQNQRYFLVDCGADIHRALATLNYGHDIINNVYISHLHSDHVGGLEWLALSRYFDENCVKPNLYLPGNLNQVIWDDCLKAGLSTLQKKTQLETYFNPIVCAESQPFEWERVAMTPVFSYHTPSDEGYMPCYGLWIESSNTRVFFTSDSIFDYQYNKERFEKANIIFHDCETSSLKSGVHAHYEQLCTLPNDIKSKMYLYHYHNTDGYTPVKDGFLGFVKRGQEFEFH